MVLAMKLIAGFETVMHSSREEWTRDAKPGVSRKRSIWKKQESYTKELIALFVLVGYLVNIMFGKRLNESIAAAWTDAFASEGSILEKNFALLGVDDVEEEMMLKETHNIFKFYASGRRYCQGLLATLDLKARQDLVSMAFSTLTAKQDTLDIDVCGFWTDMGWRDAWWCRCI